MALEPIQKSQPETPSFAAPKAPAPDMFAPRTAPTAGSELLKQTAPDAPDVAFADTLDPSAPARAPTPAQAGPAPKAAQAPRPNTAAFAPAPDLNRASPMPMAVPLSGTVLAVTPAHDPNSLSDRMVASAPVPAAPTVIPDATMGMGSVEIVKGLQIKRSMELLGAWNEDAQKAGANFLNKLDAPQVSAMYNVLNHHSKGAMQLDPKSTRQTAIDEAIVAVNGVSKNNDPELQIKSAVFRADQDYVEFAPNPTGPSTGLALAAVTPTPDADHKMVPQAPNADLSQATMVPPTAVPNAQPVAPTAQLANGKVAPAPAVSAMPPQPTKEPLLGIGAILGAPLAALNNEKPAPTAPVDPKVQLANDKMAPAPQQHANAGPPVTAQPPKPNEPFLGLGNIVGAPVAALNNGQPVVPTAPGAPVAQNQTLSNVPGTPSPQGPAPTLPAPGLNNTAQPADPTKPQQVAAAELAAPPATPAPEFNRIHNSVTEDGGTHVRHEIKDKSGAITVTEEKIDAPRPGGQLVHSDNSSSTQFANSAPALPAQGYRPGMYRAALTPEVTPESKPAAPAGPITATVGTIGDSPTHRAGATKTLTPQAFA